jgi:glycosyltransferase involved in cell wall biosynthesis
VPGPLVTVGIPTYNRGRLVQRAVRSALGQDHDSIEVVVFDDASTDETAAVLESMAEVEPRLRYVSQDQNVGHARNFQAALDSAAGEYFMWLSDDDWIDPTYVSTCLRVLRGPGNHALVGGLARYHSGGEHVVDERPTDLLSARPGARVLGYLTRVNVNGVLFGLARRADVQRISFADVVGGDWLLVAGLAARGRVRTLPNVHIHRSMEGLSSDAQGLARSFGLKGLIARHHHFAVAARFAGEILRSPAYARLGFAQRAFTAVLAAALIILRFPGQNAVRWVLQRAGRPEIEDRVIAWVRARD